MYKSIFIQIALFITSLGFGQTPESLKIATKKIYDANYHMDFDAVSALTLPEVRAQLGGEKMVDKLDADYQNDKYRMRLQLTAPVFQYGPLVEHGGKTYCIIKYKNPVRYFYETKLDSNSSLIEANFLREKDQTRDVTFEPKRNGFNVRRISTLVAISDASKSQTWTFINLDDPQQRTLLPQVIDEDGLKKLDLLH